MAEAKWWADSQEHQRTRAIVAGESARFSDCRGIQAPRHATAIHYALFYRTRRTLAAHRLPLHHR